MVSTSAAWRGATATARMDLRVVAHRVGVACGLNHAPLSRFVSLTDLVAGEAVTGVRQSGDRTFSAINGTGIPVQFSVAIGDGPATARVLGEAGWPGLSMHERLVHGGRQLLAVLDALDQRAVVPAIDQLLVTLLPRRCADLDGWTGAIWCGVVVTDDGQVGTRLYLNQRWGSLTERIARLRTAVMHVAGADAAERWHEASRLMTEDLKPYGVALDVTAAGVSRIKVYAAARTASRITIAPYLMAAIPSCDLSACDAFLHACWELGGWSRPRMVMPCLEFGRGAPVRGKVDVALCTLPSTDVQLDALLRRTLRQCELPADRYAAFIDAVSDRPLDGSRVRRLQYASVGVRADRRDLTVYASPELD